MSLVYASVLVLASMVAILAGMVGYMYWQQNRVLHIVNTLSSFVSSQFVKTDEPEDDHVDDRASVEKETEVVDSVVPDDLEAKTSAELKELLNSKGVPYGKRDSKAALVKLVKESQ